MIRAGRRHLVRTMAELAKDSGLSLGSYRNKRPYAAEGHPPPISSPGARVLLWDAEQVHEFQTTGTYTPLPIQESDDDLLDRREAAQLRDITPKTWDSNTSDPQLQDTVQVVGGVEHWPRGIIRDFRRTKPEAAAPAHRPTGAGDAVPRDQLPSLVEELLAEDPEITGAQVAKTLGVHFLTARKILVELRGRHIAELLKIEQDLTPEQAAHRLGYPTRVIRGAVAAAAVAQRMRAVAPYLESVAEALRSAGIPLHGHAPTLQVLDERICAAWIVLAAGGPITTPALVWDERWGWRTATSRLHPIPRDHTKPPQGAGIRYLGDSIQPQPAELLDHLRDDRLRRKRPHGSWIA